MGDLAANLTSTKYILRRTYIKEAEYRVLPVSVDESQILTFGLSNQSPWDLSIQDLEVFD